MAIKISVVIPTYRRPALLAVCLEALRNQSVGKNLFEVLVVSDGPDTETELVVRNFSEGLHLFVYLFTPRKKGPAAARNLGWQTAAGSLVAFTDDDCMPDENWLKSILDSYRYERLIAYTGKIKVPLSKDPTDYEINTSNLETAEFVTANCCCTKEALRLTNGFDEQFFMAWREDSDLEFKLLEKNIPIVRLDNALVIHPVRRAPWAVSLKEQKKNFFNALLYKKYPELYRRKIQPVPPYNYYLMIIALIMSVLFTATQNFLLAFFAVSIWTGLVCHFIAKRLSNTSRSWNHVTEMVFTSVFIPFLSIYWHLRGAWKYRVFFL